MECIKQASNLETVPERWRQAAGMSSMWVALSLDDERNELKSTASHTCTGVHRKPLHLGSVIQCTGPPNQNYHTCLCGMCTVQTAAACRLPDQS